MNKICPTVILFAYDSKVMQSTGQQGPSKNFHVPGGLQGKRVEQVSVSQE